MDEHEHFYICIHCEAQGITGIKEENDARLEAIKNQVLQQEELMPRHIEYLFIPEYNENVVDSVFMVEGKLERSNPNLKMKFKDGTFTVKEIIEMQKRYNSLKVFW